MDKNLLGYEIEPKKNTKEHKIQINLQPFFIFINFLMYTVYFFTKGSSFCQSYYSQMPFLFYGLLIAYSAMLIFYSKACRSPGFAKDEVVNNSEVGDSENHDSNTFFCKYCQIYVPIRASHCLTCNKCIIRRDHHCPWTNNCIGRDNHFYFFIFTSLAFISEIIPQIDASMHFYFYFTNSNRHNDLFRIICAYVPFIAASTFGSVFTGNLCYQSILTISKNATYWERSRRARISYMKGLPFGYSPFDKGLIGNIIEFCTMKEKKMKWTIKPPDISLFSNELQIITQNQGAISD